MAAIHVYWKEKPICVDACPLRALDFAPIDELRKTYGDLAAIAPLPSPEHTAPNLVIKTNKNARPTGIQPVFSESKGGVR